MNLKRLKDIREDNDINQEEMAKILGVNRSTYSMWELEMNVIPLRVLCNFADYFNVSIDYVLGLSNNKNPKNIIKGLELKVLGATPNSADMKWKVLSKEGTTIKLVSTQPVATMTVLGKNYGLFYLFK